MVEVGYRLRYTGDEAESNRLPAHRGAVSLEGVSWSVSLIANYLATGKMKTRGTLSPEIKAFIYPARQGSFINDLILYIEKPENLFITSVLGSYAVGTAGQVINSVIVKVMKEVCGIVSRHIGGQTGDEEKWYSLLPSGDMEALVDRIEPSMRRAHEVINEGASNLLILQRQTELIVLNGVTKAYVNKNIIGDELVEKEVSVGALNANTGNGRFYLPQIGKTVPFSVDKEPATGTYQALTYSLDQYVSGRPSTIQVTCREVLALDGRIKKLIVSGARRMDIDELA
jgi:hypothetical protein